MTGHKEDGVTDSVINVHEIELIVVEFELEMSRVNTSPEVQQGGDSQTYFFFHSRHVGGFVICSINHLEPNVSEGANEEVKFNLP